MNVGVVLAAGKGTRFKAEGKNKTAVSLRTKPLVRYGVELLLRTCDRVYVVVGAYSDSVREALSDLDVVYVVQGTQATGTGYAVQCAVEKMREQSEEVDKVIVGYGDHMMFYTDEVIEGLLREVEGESVVSMVSTTHENPSELRWGRVIRNNLDGVQGIVEEKEATDEERKITELNAGLYGFSWGFLDSSIDKLQPAAVSGELYLTDMIKIAVTEGLQIKAIKVPFEQVGYGVNTPEDLERSEGLKRKDS